MMKLIGQPLSEAIRLSAPINNKPTPILNVGSFPGRKY